jgi:hypothetical protein
MERMSPGLFGTSSSNLLPSTMTAKMYLTRMWWGAVQKERDEETGSPSNQWEVKSWPVQVKHLSCGHFHPWSTDCARVGLSPTNQVWRFSFRDWLQGIGTHKRSICSWQSWIWDPAREWNRIDSIQECRRLLQLSHCCVQQIRQYKLKPQQLVFQT